MTCEGCMYYDEKDKFCHNPAMWAEIIESRFKIGCSQRSEETVNEKNKEIWDLLDEIQEQIEEVRNKVYNIEQKGMRNRE